MGRHMVLAQKRLAAACGLPLRILSFNDPAGLQRLTVAGEEIEFEGFNKDRRRFTRQAVSAARNASLVYINHVNLSPIGLLMKLRRPTLPYVVHVHGIEVWRPLPLVRQLCLKQSAMVTSTSHYTAQLMGEQQQFVPKRVEVLYPTLDPDLLEAKETLLPPDQIPAQMHPLLQAHIPFLFTVSRLDTTERYKGIDTAIIAFSQIRDRFPEAHYVIVGSGDDLPRLQAIAVEHGVKDRVLFLGRQPDEILHLLYRHCAAFVLPSAKEGLGIVFLEAMAASKPCIGGNTGGTPEVVREGENGFLVSYDDPEDQARAMAEMLGDKALCTRLGQAGHRILMEELTYDHFERRFQGLLRELMPGCAAHHAPVVAG